MVFFFKTALYLKTEKPQTGFQGIVCKSEHQKHVDFDVRSILKHYDIEGLDLLRFQTNYLSTLVDITNKACQ